MFFTTRRVGQAMVLTLPGAVHVTVEVLAVWREPVSGKIAVKLGVVAPRRIPVNREEKVRAIPACRPGPPAAAGSTPDEPDA